MKGSITFRLMVFFVLALLVSALVSSLLFGRLFANWVLGSKRTEMLKQGQELSQSLSNLLDSQDAAGRGQGSQGSPGGRGMMGEGTVSFQAYVRLLTQTRRDLWVLDENLQVLSSGRMMGRTLGYDSLPQDAGSLVKAVFDDQTPFSEGFSELMGAPTLTLGVPIYKGGQVAGALLLHDTVAGMEEYSRQGQGILLLSAALALGLGILLSLGLSISFTRPIAQVEETARRLAMGDYTARTGISGRDEIAHLAASMDVLSSYLQEARQKESMQEQQRRDFFASVSHELRTPLTVIRGSLEALYDQVVTDPALVQEYYAQLLAETASMQRLVNDLLELARLENTAFTMEMEEIDLTQVFKEAIRAATLMAKEKDVAVISHAELSPLVITGDYARLKQMLLIPLDNAIKFSNPGDTITATLKPGIIIIKDQGPGIPEEELPHLYDRFHSTRQQGERSGSGLGLAIARQIALRHHINLAITSPGEGGTLVEYTWVQGSHNSTSRLGFFVGRMSCKARDLWL